MKRLVIESWLLLLWLDFVIRFRRFKDLHEIVRRKRANRNKHTDIQTPEVCCLAVDYASVIYFRKISCLHRSSATTLLLRRYGWNAEMVIGAQLLPFKSHAWVEVNGVVINDKPYVPEIYQELERC
jgi:Transglutaminase-like superfamily